MHTKRYWESEVNLKADHELRSNPKWSYLETPLGIYWPSAWFSMIKDLIQITTLHQKFILIAQKLTSHLTFYDDVIYAQEKVKRGSLVRSCKYDIVKHPVRRQFLSYWRKTFNMYCQLSWNQLGKLLYGYWLRRLRKGVRNLRRRFSVKTVSFPAYVHRC